MDFGVNILLYEGKMRFILKKSLIGIDLKGGVCGQGIGIYYVFKKDT